MSEFEEKCPEENGKASLPEQKPDQAQSSAASEELLSPKRRSAVVTYLGFLFAIAFLFVAIMFLIETKRLQTMNQELDAKNKRDSASLTNNINALQNENAKLRKDLEEQEADLMMMRTQADISADEIKALDQKIEFLESQLNEQKQAFDTEKSELNKKLQEQTRRAEDAITVSELLNKAVNADEKNDVETLKTLLKQIEPLKELLSDSEKEIYEKVVLD